MCEIVCKKCGYSQLTSGTPESSHGSRCNKTPPNGTAQFQVFSAPAAGKPWLCVQYNMNMQSPTPSVHVGFPKPGRNGRTSTNHAAHPVVTKQRSLLSQSLLSAEADRDARRCSKLEQALDVSELSESEESAMDVEEEDVPCCNGALQIPTRYVTVAMLSTTRHFGSEVVEKRMDATVFFPAGASRSRSRDAWSCSESKCTSIR